MKDIMKSHPILSSVILLNSEIAMLVGYIPMNNKILTMAALLAAALLAGIFSATTPMTVYAEDDYDDDHDDDDDDQQTGVHGCSSREHGCAAAAMAVLASTLRRLPQARGN